MTSLIYIMYNKRLNKKKKLKVLKDDENPLICEDITSDDKWFMDEELEAISTYMQ